MEITERAGITIYFQKRSELFGHRTEHGNDITLCRILVNCTSGGCGDHQDLERMRNFLSTPSHSTLLLSFEGW
jgi:hypothetical protein